MGVASYNWGAGSSVVGLFLLSYLLLVTLLAALLSLGWSLELTSAGGAWPHPARYGRAFNVAFLGLLSALGGFPPFFLLAPKLALFSWLVSLGAWGALAFLGALLLLGWYVYWQAATALFEQGGGSPHSTLPLSRGGALVPLFALLLPLGLSGALCDLWLFAQWLG